MKPHLLIIVQPQKIRYFSLFLDRFKEDGSKTSTSILSLNISGSRNCMITSKYLFELSPKYTFLFHSSQNDPKSVVYKVSIVLHRNVYSTPCTICFYAFWSKNAGSPRPNVVSIADTWFSDTLVPTIGGNTLLYGK